MRRRALLLTVLLGCLPAAAQEYFADGYHGGIYGHYPLWNTQFMVDRLTEHPAWRIHLEIEPETWDSVRLRTPEAYRAFRRLAATGRVEFVNPTYAQPYLYNITGESVIRQFAYGIRKLREHFPDAPLHTYSAEEPCFTSCLPQILQGFGLRYAVLKCPDTCWGGYTPPAGGETIEWVGPDGTSLPAVPRYDSEALVEGSTWQTAAWNNSADYLAAARAQGIRHPVGMCYQDAGWRNGPWLGSDGRTEYLTWSHYIERIADPPADRRRLTQEETVLPHLMWGSQVLQTLARQVRRAEERLVQAEKADAIRRLRGDGRYAPARLDEAWRTLLLAQHHDCWIVPYNRLHGPHTWADHVGMWCDSTLRIADEMLAAAGGEAGTHFIRVTNTTAEARREVVEATLPAAYADGAWHLTDTRGREVPLHRFVRAGEGAVWQFTADVPPFGAVNYRIAPGRPTRADSARCRAGREGAFFVVQSDRYRLLLDPTRGGAIRSLRDLHTGRETVDTASVFGFNTLRGHFWAEGGFRSSTEEPAQIRTVECTPRQVTVEIAGRIASYPFRQRITLRADEARIDCSLEIDWQGRPRIGEYDLRGDWRAARRPFCDDRYKLLLLFPAALHDARLAKDAPFDVCTSRYDDTFFPSWDRIKHNVILRWVDLAQRDGRAGLTLMSDHTTSYVHGSQFPLALTVQYAGRGLWGMDYALTHPTRIRYALLPHTGAWDEAQVWSAAARRAEPLLVHLTREALPEGSLVRLSQTGYAISAAQACDEGVLLRLFNAEGDARPVTVRFGRPVAEVRETTLDGRTLRTLPLHDDGVEIAMPRFGIRNLLIVPEK